MNLLSLSVPGKSLNIGNLLGWYINPEKAGTHKCLPSETLTASIQNKEVHLGAQKVAAPRDSQAHFNIFDNAKYWYSLAHIWCLIRYRRINQSHSKYINQTNSDILLTCAIRTSERINILCLFLNIYQLFRAVAIYTFASTRLSLNVFQ